MTVFDSKTLQRQRYFQQSFKLPRNRQAAKRQQSRTRDNDQPKNLGPHIRTGTESATAITMNAWLDEHGNGKHLLPAHPDHCLLDAVRADRVRTGLGTGKRKYHTGIELTVHWYALSICFTLAHGVFLCPFRAAEVLKFQQDAPPFSFMQEHDF